MWCTTVGAGQWQLGASFFGVTGEQRMYLDMFLRYLKEGLERQRKDTVDPDDSGGAFG